MIRRYMARFMAGRYGGDQLNLLLIALYLLFYVVYLFTRLIPFEALALILIILSLYRSLSRNLARRRAENTRFLQIVRLPRPRPRPGAPLFQVPQLRPTDAGAPGQGAHHRPLPVLRRGV